MGLFSGISEDLFILKMMKHNYRSLKEFKLYVTVLTLMMLILISFPALSWSGSNGSNRGVCFQDAQTYDQKLQKRHRNAFNFPDKHWFYAPSNRRNSCLLLSKNYRKRYDRLSPEEKTMLKRRYQEWESLPEYKQQMLRRRMKKYQQLPPGSESGLNKGIGNCNNFRRMSAITSGKSFKNGTGCPLKRKNRSVNGFEVNKAWH